MPQLNRLRVPRAIVAGLVTFGFAALSACGFQPVYNTQGSGLGPISVAPIDGRTGYYLRQELARRAGLESGNTPSRALSVKLITAFTPVAVGTDGISQRTQMTVTAQYSLESPAPAGPVTGTVSTNVAYESFDQAYGDIALQADAEERVAAQIAESVWFDLQRQVRAQK